MSGILIAASNVKFCAPAGFPKIQISHRIPFDGVVGGCSVASPVSATYRNSPVAVSGVKLALKASVTGAHHAVAALPVVFWLSVGTSAVTRARGTTAPEPPVVGPANTVL